jgi:uncharacterized membrane protein YeaQ/YmgE (transglycosylase-associated protein family)
VRLHQRRSIILNAISEHSEGVIVDVPLYIILNGEVMGIIILLVVGGIIGWVASLIMRTDAQQGIFLNVVVGIVGALIAGFVVTPLVGGAPITSGEINIMSILISLLGAIVLLAVVNLVRRGSVR